MWKGRRQARRRAAARAGKCVSRRAWRGAAGSGLQEAGNASPFQQKDRTTTNKLQEFRSETRCNCTAQCVEPRHSATCPQCRPAPAPQPRRGLALHQGGESQAQSPAKRQHPKRQGKFSPFPKQALPPHVQEPLTLLAWPGRMQELPSTGKLLASMLQSPALH